jgi:hypothetical protein
MGNIHILSHRNQNHYKRISTYKSLNPIQTYQQNKTAYKSWTRETRHRHPEWNTSIPTTM